jgi:hypothetical protein
MTTTGATARFEDRTAGPNVLPPDVDLAAPLRDASRFERVLRCLLAALVAAALGFTFYESVRGPTVVESHTIYAALLNAAGAGQVTRIDDTRDAYVVWKQTDGHVYAQRAYDLVDLRASVAAQPYVRAHPGSIRYGPIAARPVVKPERRRVARALGTMAILLAIVTGPAPRHFTRWGWLWICGTGVGVVPYLLLSGSRRRTAPARPWRRDGVFGAAVAVVYALAATLVTSAVVPDPPSGHLAPGIVEPVVARRA